VVGGSRAHSESARSARSRCCTRPRAPGRPRATLSSFMRESAAMWAPLVATARRRAAGTKEAASCAVLPFLEAPTPRGSEPRSD
jgi:hypothetical protein